MELFVEHSFSQEGQKVHAPAQERLALGVEISHRGKRLMKVVVIVKGDADLPEIGHARVAIGAIARGARGWFEQSGKGLFIES